MSGYMSTCKVAFCHGGHQSIIIASTDRFIIVVLYKVVVAPTPHSYSTDF